MEVPTIPPVEVEAQTTPDMEGVARARSLEVTVSEPPEVGGTGRGLTPLELFLLGLAACEVSMFRMIAQRMRVEYGRVTVRVRGIFEVGVGLREVAIRYVVEDAGPGVERVIEGVRKMCPVYNTLKRAGVVITEEVVA
ncbi:MAG: OsmC family protein [Desulfurococcales archaeon]|nr:OsmC family protein [Desulfurococcales archaeon]